MFSKDSKFRVICIILVIILLLQVSSVFAAETKPQEEWFVGVILATLRHPFFSNSEQACADAGKKYSFKVEVLGSDSDAVKQVAQVEDFITKGVDMLLLCPVVQGALVSVVNKANKAGIPVMILNRRLGEGADTICYVGADDYQGGQLQAEIIAEAIGEQGNIVLLQGTLGSSPQVCRQKGMEDSISANYPDIKVVAKYPCDFDKAKAIAVVQDILVKYSKGEIDGIVTQSTEMAMGAAQVLEKRDRTEIKIVAFDNPSYVKEAIAEGRLYGTVLQDPYLQAMIAMDAVWLYLSGNGDYIPKPNYTTPLIKVTKNNVDETPTSW